MTRQAFNPYLPSWEYVADAGLHTVGDRVYIQGFHDLFNGISFCTGRTVGFRYFACGTRRSCP